MVRMDTQDLRINPMLLARSPGVVALQTQFGMLGFTDIGHDKFLVRIWLPFAPKQRLLAERHLRASFLAAGGWRQPDAYGGDEFCRVVNGMDALRAALVPCIYAMV